ncbi:MAG TPA: autotransporter-associated beta strand repeat-containing protein, partial [Candidatus Methylacidiphilales bacterium]|nr:autotransporter-associated beta strand repeat-containing protein [Candidatus Methylacidiphilales bacterium]
TNGTLDISSSSGIGLGALNGTGRVTLGNENLSLGEGNQSSNFSGVISDTGSGSLTKVGTGEVTLSGTNTYAGGTTVSAGTLQVGSTNALGASTGSLTVNGGTLDLDGFSITVGTFSGTGGMITSSTNGAVTLTTGGSGTATYAGTIQDGSGTVSFTEAGSGTLELTGDNTYSGGTTVTSGTLQVGNTDALGATTGSLTVNGGTLDLNGTDITVGTLSGTGGTITSSVAGAVSLTVGSSGTATYAGTIQDGSGTVSLTEDGSGTLELTGDNTYSGGTTITSGTLQVGNTNALGATTGSLTVNGGTLDLNGFSITTGEFSGTGGTITSSVDGASLTVGGSGMDTYAGTIEDGSGTVSLTEDGSGELELTGDNSYSGGTTIASGTLQVGNTDALGATTGSLTVNGGTLDLNGFSITVGTFSGTGGMVTSSVAGAVSLTVGGSGTATYAGTIQDGSGTVSLTEAGNGTLELTGDNSYSGGTTIASGTLQVGNTDALGATTGSLTVNGGTLDLNGFNITVGTFSGTGGTVTSSVAGAAGLTAGGSGTATYAGTIQDGSGTVSFTEAGSGTLQLTGDNSYSGGTTITSGTLQVGNTDALGATTGSLTVNGGELDLNGFDITTGTLSGTGGVITSSTGDASLTVGGSGDSTFAGTIEDDGIVSLIKMGSGTLTLTGDNTYSGGTTISAGVLQVGGAMALGMGNVLLNGGTLRTNGVQHTINVGGNYTQTGGTLALSLLGSASNENENLAVTGTASLGGGLLINGNNAVVTSTNTTYDLVHSSGDTGTFDSFNYTNLTAPTGYAPTLTYETDDVILGFKQALFGSVPGLTPNQQAVANYIDSFETTVTTGNFGNLLNNLAPLIPNPASLGSALDEISPQSLQVWSDIAFDNAMFASQQLGNHLANLRDGMTGFDGSQLAFHEENIDPALSQVESRLLAWDPSTTPGEISDVVDPVVAGVSSQQCKECSHGCASDRVDSWSTFIAGDVVLADVTHNTDLSHQNYTTGSVTAGADYRIGRHWVVGGLVAYGHTDANLDHIGSTTTVDSYSPAIYASYVDGGWYGNALFSYGYNSYTEARNVQIGTLVGTNTGAPDGSQYVGNLTGGYEFTEGAWKIGPVASAQYVNLEVNSFTEQGPTALNVQSESDESFRTQLGFDARYAGHVQGWFGSFELTPHFSAAWQHEYLDDSRGITSQFNQVGAGSFTVQTTGPDRDSAFIDLGIDAQVENEVMLFLDYETQAGQDDYFAQSIQGGIKIVF